MFPWSAGSPQAAAHASDPQHRVVPEGPLSSIPQNEMQHHEETCSSYYASLKAEHVAAAWCVIKAGSHSVTDILEPSFLIEPVLTR
jgi:hypothetical protein